MKMFQDIRKTFRRNRKNHINKHKRKQKTRKTQVKRGGGKSMFRNIINTYILTILGVYAYYAYGEFSNIPVNKEKERLLFGKLEFIGGANSQWSHRHKETIDRLKKEVKEFTKHIDDRKTAHSKAIEISDLSVTSDILHKQLEVDSDRDVLRSINHLLEEYNTNTIVGQAVQKIVEYNEIGLTYFREFSTGIDCVDSTFKSHPSFESPKLNGLDKARSKLLDDITAISRDIKVEMNGFSKLITQKTKTLTKSKDIFSDGLKRIAQYQPNKLISDSQNKSPNEQQTSIVVKQDIDDIVHRHIGNLHELNNEYLKNTEEIVSNHEREVKFLKDKTDEILQRLNTYFQNILKKLEKMPKIQQSRSEDYEDNIQYQIFKYKIYKIVYTAFRYYKEIMITALLLTLSQLFMKTFLTNYNEPLSKKDKKSPINLRKVEGNEDNVYVPDNSEKGKIKHTKITNTGKRRKTNTGKRRKTNKNQR